MKRIKQDSSRKASLMDQESWLAATTCQVCETAIDQGTPRIMVVAVKLAFDVDDDSPSSSQLSQASIVGGSSPAGQGSWKVGKLISCCNGCAEGIDDFSIGNPWSLRKRPDTQRVNGSASLETCGAEMKAEAAATQKTLSECLASEDTRNSTHSVRPGSELTARQTRLEHETRKSVAVKPSGQNPIAARSGNARTTGSAPGEDKQRAKLLKFLNAPASQGMRPQMRQAGRHWAEGFSQSDVARKLNMDPSTVARVINGALKMADAPRLITVCLDECNDSGPWTGMSYRGTELGSYRSLSADPI
jgi:hypothetical protein